MEYYSATRRNKILSYTAIQMSFEDTMPCQVRYEETNIALHLHEVPRAGKLTRWEAMGTRGGMDRMKPPQSSKIEYTQP